MEESNPISVAILTLLTFVSLALTGYVTLYCYTHFKSKSKTRIELPQGHWLDNERKPLIPGNFHAETVQPNLSNFNDLDEEDSIDETDTHSKERDFTKLGRIIFVMRYNRKREELMVRLVQIEGMPVSHDLYTSNSAYVDVQLKYTGNPDCGGTEVQRPPRLDICLQQVYYFIITKEQMMSHSLEFQVNTFDDQFRRYVSGMVEVNLREEMGDDILSGAEVVFVKEILEPMRASDDQNVDEEEYNSNELTQQEVFDDVATTSRPSSRASSNMSWEPESKELLTLSTNSLYFRCASEQDLTLNPLTDYKRSHSIGYLATHEWTICDIPLDDGNDVKATSPTDNTDAKLQANKIENMHPTPKSFYHIVPMTPLVMKDTKSELETSLRRFAFKKHPKRKQLGRSLTINKRSTAKKASRLPSATHALDRSSSWPSLVTADIESSTEVSPEHQFGMFFT